MDLNCTHYSPHSVSMQWATQHLLLPAMNAGWDGCDGMLEDAVVRWLVVAIVVCEL